MDDERSGAKQHLPYPPKVKEKILKAIDVCNPSFRYKDITLLAQCIYTDSDSDAKMDDVLDFMERLLKRGADPNEEAGNGVNHLVISLDNWPERYRIRRTKLLLKHGAKASTALCHALHSTEMTRLLLEHGASLLRCLFR